MIDISDADSFFATRNGIDISDADSFFANGGGIDISDADEFFKNQDSSLNKIQRGYQSAVLKVPEIAIGIDSLFGTNMMDKDSIAKINSTRELLDKQKEETSQANISPDRKLEIDTLRQEAQNAKGTWDNVKMGARQMYDVAVHPSEWTLQGVTEGLLAPENIASFGVGTIATKATTLGAKTLFGSLAGAVENVSLGTPMDYLQAKGQGKTDEEAKNVAIQSATGNTLAGAGMGALGGLASRGKKPIDTKSAEQINAMTPEEIVVSENLAKELGLKPEEAKVAETISEQNNIPIEEATKIVEDAKNIKSLDEQMELIRTHDRGGEEQAQTYKAQMQSWADRENANRVEQGLEPTVTADDMARQNPINYENKARPTEAELNTLFETATDANGNFKTIGDRNKSHGWQDTQNTDAYGQEYTTRMAGERGLDSEVTTPVSTLKKLKEEGYNALNDAERAMVDRDIDTIRNHPDFKTLEQKDNSTHINENGELVDADGNYLFQTNDLSFKDKIKEIKNNLGLESFSVYEGEKDITLTMIKVPKDKQKQGLGTKAINELIKIADEKGKRVVLTTGTRDDIHGTTSKNRLISFYKKFGFVENKGRNKDWSIIENMYREPSSIYQKDTNTLFQSAYHGTPHNVDKFSTDKIGTGEGNQAYGHGLYFADSKSVAEHYKNRLSNQELLFDGKKTSTLMNETKNQIFNHVDIYHNDGMSKSEILSQLEDSRLREAQSGNKYFTDEKYKQVIDYVRNTKELKRENNGNLYKVDLKPKEEEYLQWDKPLSEQSLHVREALEKELDIYRKSEGAKGAYINDSSGERLYKEFTTTYGGEKLASERLNELGIRGIKYEDGNSRSRDTNKNHNYVIFNDKDVEVIGANGKHYDPSIPDTLFQGEKYPQGVKGAYSIDSKLIQIFESHDVSTLNHELGHRFLHTLSEKEFSVASEIFGVKDGKWTREQHEAFADAYARYIAEGKTPVKGLKAIFDKFKKFTIEILKSLKENNGGKMPKLSPEMKEFFSATLGHEPSRAKLFERIKEKESKADMGDGTLYQTASQKEHLKEVYKDSHPLTKNEDGTPKVFYHGTMSKKPFYVFNTENSPSWFTTNKTYAGAFAPVGGNIFETYLHVKNPMWVGNIDGIINDVSLKRLSENSGVSLDKLNEIRGSIKGVNIFNITNGKEFRDIAKSMGYDGLEAVEGRTQALAVFNPTQIKSIHNKPLSEGKSPDFENSNILYQIPKNLLASDQLPKVGDDAKKFKEGYEKVKNIVSQGVNSFKDITPQFYKDLTSDRFTAIARLQYRAEVLHKGLMKLSPNANKILQQAIVGDIKDLPQGYKPLKPLVSAIQQEVKNYTRALVKAGMLDIETAKAYGDSYLKRTYEKHWSSKSGDVQSGDDKGVKPIIARGKELMADSPDDVLSFVESYLDAHNKKPLPTTIMDISDIKDELTNLGVLGDSIVDGKMIWKEDANGKITLKRDWTKAEREKMGEIENASFSVPNTILSMGMMLENAKLMKNMRPYSKVFKDIDEAKANGYDQIPNTKRYGELAGVYMDKEVVDNIKYSFESVGDLKQFYSKALSVWKQGKTVFNPTSHFNNFVSNITTQFMLGRDMKEALKMMAESARMLKEFPTKIAKYEEMVVDNTVGMLTTKDKAEFAQLQTDLKYYIEGKENGLFGRGQIVDILKGFDAQGNSFGNKGIASRSIEAVQKLYQRGDDIPRLASYKVLRENGMSAKESKDFVTALYPDYSKPLPKGIRFLRDSGLSPFISWSYYVLPNLWKLVKKHPTRATALISTIYIGSYLASGINPFGDEIPDKEQGRRVPISNDGTTLKIDRMIAGSDFGVIPMDIVSKVAQGVSKGDTIGGVNKAVSATGRNVGKLAQSYLFGGPAQLGFELSQNRNFYTGRPISGDDDNSAKQAYNYMKHIGGFVAPAPMANMGGIVENQINPKLKRKHSDVEPRTTTQEIIKQFGLNTQTYNTNEVMRKRRQEEAKNRK